MKSKRIRLVLQGLKAILSQYIEDLLIFSGLARYGQRMKLDTFSDSDGATAAQKARTLLSQLNTVSEEITIHTYGADSVTAGVVLAFNLAEFTGNFLVKSVTHNYDHPHTMDLTLKRK